MNTIRASNSLDPDQARSFIGPDLAPNCLQKLSADDIYRRSVNFCFCCFSERTIYWLRDIFQSILLVCTDQQIVWWKGLILSCINMRSRLICLDMTTICRYFDANKIYRHSQHTKWGHYRPTSETTFDVARDCILAGDIHIRGLNASSFINFFT